MSVFKMKITIDRKFPKNPPLGLTLEQEVSGETAEEALDAWLPYVRHAAQAIEVNPEDGNGGA